MSYIYGIIGTYILNILLTVFSVYTVYTVTEYNTLSVIIYTILSPYITAVLGQHRLTFLSLYYFTLYYFAKPKQSVRKNTLHDKINSK